MAGVDPVRACGAFLTDSAPSRPLFGDPTEVSSRPRLDFMDAMVPFR